MCRAAAFIRDDGQSISLRGARLFEMGKKVSELDQPLSLSHSLFGGVYEYIYEYITHNQIRPLLFRTTAIQATHYISSNEERRQCSLLLQLPLQTTCHALEINAHSAIPAEAF